MKQARAEDIGNNNSPRAQAVASLVEADRESGRPIRNILRDMQTASVDTVESMNISRKLALSVMRHRNSIDFMIGRVIRQSRDHFDDTVRNALRLAVYESVWLHAPVDEILGQYSQWLEPWKGELKTVVESSLHSMVEQMPLANRLSLTLSHPTFLVQTLLDNMREDDAVKLLQSLNGPRRYYVRPNRLRETMVEGGFLRKLKEHPIVLKQDPDLPHVWEVKEGIQYLVSTSEFKEGDVIVQDKASVLAVDSLGPGPGERVWDACAAPGMKTQLLAERVGAGSVVASDVYRSRIAAGRHLTATLGAVKAEWIHADATAPAVREVDKILIDAPCSSTGVLQTYPSFKWRLNKATLFALMTIQNKILDGVLASFSGASGTEIVYSTCSILPHEGESQIDSALSRHNIELLEPIVTGSPGYPGFKCSSMVRRLFPHLHGCNGFFIARMRIKQ